MVEYILMAFDDLYLELHDDLDLAEHFVKGSVRFLHCHFHRLNVVDYCHSEMEIVNI